MPSRSPSPSAGTAASTAARSAQIATARSVCRAVSALCLAWVLLGGSAAAQAALQAGDLAGLAATHPFRIALVVLAGELTGWWLPTRLVGLQNFRDSPLFALAFSGGARKVIWRMAYFVMSFLYRCAPPAVPLLPSSLPPPPLHSPFHAKRPARPPACAVAATTNGPA